MKIEIGKSSLRKRGRSLFLHLDPVGEEETLELEEALLSLPEVKEVGYNRFEIPERFFERVLLSFDKWDIEIYGDVPKKILAYINSRNAIIDSVPSGAFEYKTAPFEHQVECFEYAKEKEAFLLGDEQGLGKTKQAIDIAVSRKGGFKHCLIVCCVSGLKWNWAKEIEVHSNEESHILGSRINRSGNIVIDGVAKRVDDLLVNHDEFFLITNIETLRDKNFAASLEQLTSHGEIGMVVVDEIHKCKNPTSQQGKALHKLKSFYKMALTGTPLMNSPVDVYNVLKWLGVENHNFTQFKERYCILDNFGMITGYTNLSELRELVESNMLRRKKEDVLDLPEKIRVTEYVDMSTAQASIYKEAKTQIIENIDKVRLSNNPLAEFIRLRQATGNPQILTTKDVKSSKFERAMEIIEEASLSGDSVVVFSNWSQVIVPFSEYVKKATKKEAPTVTGETKDKFEVIETFMNHLGPSVLCGTIGALGTGFTLTKASTVIFLDSPWTKADKDQAEDRVHRIGAKNNVTIYTLVAKNTIDERIEEIIAKKGELSDYVIDGERLLSPVGNLFDVLLK